MPETIKQEILRRYKYLYENKEIILSLCIKEGIEEQYYNKCLRGLRQSLAKFRKDGFKSQELKDIFKDIERKYKDELKSPKLYLMNEIDSEIIALLEGFLFGDTPLEESSLFQEIEQIKSDDLEMAQAEYLIEGLRERRKSNMHLKKRNPFTVWRILNYVRNNNPQNSKIKAYLDIYYNIDRSINSDIDWESGYYLSESDYNKNEDFINAYPNLDVISGVKTEYEESAVITPFHQNEFEREDDYFEQPLTSSNIHEQPIEYTTNFVEKAISCIQISSSDKKRLKEQLQGMGKNYIY